MLSDNIKILRKKKGYSQETLAEQLHVVRQTISKWEKGISVPDAVMLGVSPLTAVASFAAVSALFVLPTYPTLLAAVEMDDTGSTRIGKYVFNHAFLIPGVIAITLCVVLGFIIGSVLL